MDCASSTRIWLRAAPTDIRRAFGLEAAQLALRHASSQFTDAVYAEPDWTRVVAVMSAIG